MTDTTDLVKRLEAGETGREIDAEIFAALGWVIAEDYLVGSDNPIVFVRHPTGLGGTHTPLKVTTSLDAAVALVERVLPGWRKGFRQHDDIEGDGWFAWLNSPDYRTECYTAGGETRTSVASGTRFNADAPTPAAALIAALLKAEG